MMMKWFFEVEKWKVEKSVNEMIASLSRSALKRASMIRKWFSTIIRILILTISKKHAINIFMKFEKLKNHIKLNFSKILLTKIFFWHTNLLKTTKLKNCFWLIIMKKSTLILIKNATYLLMLCFHFFRKFEKIQLIIL